MKGYDKNNKDEENSLNELICNSNKAPYFRKDFVLKGKTTNYCVIYEEIIKFLQVPLSLPQFWSLIGYI